jgi:hypothetical protein
MDPFAAGQDDSSCQSQPKNMTAMKKRKNALNVNITCLLPVGDKSVAAGQFADFHNTLVYCVQGDRRSFRSIHLRASI